MTVNLTSPVTGGAQTGLTSPTYTLTADVAPDANGRQWAVTALGGTQTNVATHSVASPFTITYWKPKIAKILGMPNPVTGVVSNVPNNTHKFIVRKGVTPLAGQPSRVMVLTLQMDVPAGADTADAEDIRAGLSLLVGAANQVSAGIGDTLVSGIM